jgi:membrane-bound ClpP family serine protease
MNLDMLAATSLLFVGAFICLIAELVVPAHGFMALLCAAFTISGIISSFIVGPIFGMICLFAALILTPILVAAFVKFYPHSPVGRRVLLRGPNPLKISASSKEQQIELSALVGREGVAITMLRPSGAGLFESQRIACISDGPIIEKGNPIRGVGVSGGQLVVQATGSS